MEDRICKQVIQFMQENSLSHFLAAQAKKKAHLIFPQNPDTAEDRKDEYDRGLSIPPRHTTAAHKLLMWPSIKALLHPKTCNEDYVMDLEQGRNPIQVYGQGEGDDTSKVVQQGQQQSPSMANVPSHPTPNWDQGSLLAGSPSGATGRASAGTTTAIPGRLLKTVKHGMGESMLITNPETVRRLHLSYVNHLHKLHPFLDENDLKKKMETFICIYCSSTRPLSASTMSSGTDRGAKRSKRSKRKRSPSPTGARPDPEFPSRIELSIDNAVVLLVLALGSICECCDCPVSGPVPWSDHKEGSMDVIPGLAYYRYAAQILGLQGGNGLPHVQAALLAGLYAGQLAHPFQSHRWIYQAAGACQVLVRSYVHPISLGKLRLLTRRVDMNRCMMVL